MYLLIKRLFCKHRYRFGYEYDKKKNRFVTVRCCEYCQKTVTA